MKIAIIGAGSIGRRHARNAVALGCDVVAYDTQPLPLFGMPAGATATVTWPDDADAYVIATPASDHAASLARVGTRPALVEKPLFGASPPACFVFDHPLVMVGYNLRFHPHVGRAAVGPYATAQFWCHVDVSTWPGSSYGDTLSECSHEIDLALWMLGPGQVTDATYDGATWEIRLRHDSGSTSSISLGNHPQTHHRGGCLTGGAHRHWWTIPPTVDQTYVEEMACLLRSIRSGRILAPACTLADGLRVLAVIAEARRSAQQDHG